MRMSRKQTPISTQYELSGQVLEEVKDSKYLGVTVSDDLEWTKHINAITTKANSKLSFLTLYDPGGGFKSPPPSDFLLSRI